MPGPSRTPRPRLVVAVSTPADPHAKAVLDALRRRRTPAVLLDTALFPERLRLEVTLQSGAGWRGALRDGSAPALDPARVGAVWWRRSEPFALHASVGQDRWGGVYCACDAAAGAFWDSLDALWVNDRAAELAAEHKPSQLALASRLGLAIPRSCVTNDPAVARDFIRERPDGETIRKNVVTAAAIWQPTRVARAGDRRLLGSIRHLPLLFQERVPAAEDVRATVVGDDLFAAAIDFPRGRPALDWRLRLDQARVRPVSLPRGLASKLHRLVRGLGLRYGAIDLRRRPDGEHVFLEVNPAGEWLFVEQRTGQPITAALADLLSRGARGAAAAHGSTR